MRARRDRQRHPGRGQRRLPRRQPDIRRLLEVVKVPVADITAQNAEMAAAESYSDEQIEDDASDWIADNQTSPTGGSRRLARRVTKPGEARP